MKVIVKSSSTRPFPKLMRNTSLGGVLLMSAPRRGTLILRGEYSHQVGHWSDTWNDSPLADFEGELTLYND